MIYFFSIGNSCSFSPPKQETFFKDDANHDPQWLEEEIISANFEFNGCKIGEFFSNLPQNYTIFEELQLYFSGSFFSYFFCIGRSEVDIMRETSIVVFEILEKAWAYRNCALIDMKIEFGVDEKGQILLADVIDSDSWRLWPSGDKRLMVDKQVYRNLTTVTQDDLDTVKRNFEWISEQLDHIIPKNDNLVVILMGSPTDVEHCEKIARQCKDLGLNVELRVTSAHKSTHDTIQIVREYESLFNNLVFIAVAGRSNGLGPVLSGNTTYPVINCPPVKSDNMNIDIWSSMNVPSGLGCGTVLYPVSISLISLMMLNVRSHLF